MQNRSKGPYPQMRRHSGGATLIEILVALLVLSMGILGMAAMQIRALKGNQSSMQRTQAVMMSYYILDAMRVDRDSAKSSGYNVNTCDPASVTGTTLAKVNVKHWMDSIKSTIGTASDLSTCGYISCDADGQCTVRVQWDDLRAGGMGQQIVETNAKL